jgi:hypothetical protein
MEQSQASIRSSIRSQDGRALAAFAELEHIFNGPIPEAARLAARHGSSAIVLKIRARGEAGFFRAMARGQIQAIRRRRDDGSFYPALADDLAFYLRHWRAWRRVAAELAPAIGEIEKPRHREGGASDLMDDPSPDPGPGQISIVSR